MNLAEKEANQKIASIENEIVIIRESAYSKSKVCTSTFIKIVNKSWLSLTK